ncbi:MAG: hypothetical protein HC815_38170 [Richelia sp. RM1_1_1]|nr:hypothetical protein [Richelia sp. RM1_1_1]
MNNNQAKVYFEIHYESTVSDRTWYRIKRVIRESGLEINRENLQLIADLKGGMNIQTFFRANYLLLPAGSRIK